MEMTLGKSPTAKPAILLKIGNYWKFSTKLLQLFRSEQDNHFRTKITTTI